MKTELDDIERFEDLLGRYLYGELNAEDKRELLQFVLKNERARSMYQSSTRTNSILSRTFSDIKQTPSFKIEYSEKDFRISEYDFKISFFGFRTYGGHVIFSRRCFFLV